ncbi:MAG TPA: cation:proton antiporter [Longimicrobiales bacterium]
MESHAFLTNLALVFCVAGVTTLVFQRLRQPVVFGYLLAGLIIGPHTSIPLVADEHLIETFAELGVILLMFSLGLELSLRKLMRVGPTAGMIAVGQCSAMVWIGYVIGRAFGWTGVESIYLGAIIAISSTTIILKAFAEQGVKQRFTRLVFGVLIFEDLIAIFLLTILTTISSGAALTPGAMLATAVRLAAFLAALIGVGLLVVPRLIRLVIRMDRPEPTLVATVALCFACALVALEFGYSVALGAFIGGSLIAESGHGRDIEHLLQPVRDMFGAMFFVAVGMLIDPGLIAANIGAVLVVTAAVITGKITSVSIMAVLTGQDVKTSVQSGMSLAQIGEFSFIIAGLGLSLGATRSFLYPVAVAVSAITTLSTPWLIRWSGPVAGMVDRRLPHRVQTFVTLYGTWFERMRRPAAGTEPHRSLRRPFMLLLVDAALLVALAITTATQHEHWAARVAAELRIMPGIAYAVVLTVAVFAGGFLCAAILRVAARTSAELGRRAFPPPGVGVDFAAAPRRALTVTLRIMIIVSLGLPAVAITQPFIPLFRGSIVLVLVLAVLAIAFWRSVTNLRGHARAGAEIILMALSSQMSDETEDEEGEGRLERIRDALPGLGEPVAVALRDGSAAVGATLAEINLRGRTGATVLAIGRTAGDVLLPAGRERLAAGDTLYVAGTPRAVGEAKEVLCARAPGPVDSADGRSP